MVNTLSGSVSAYRKENVKPRFIRIDEVMALLDVTRDEAMDIALAAGARYQLAKIILVHKERLMKFMKHFARVPSSNKIVEKKFVRIEVVVVRSLNEITDDIYDLEEFVKTITDMGIWLYSLEVGPVPIIVSHAEDFGC